MITLTTDFGDSEYVGVMKGVIYSKKPGAVPKQVVVCDGGMDNYKYFFKSIENRKTH